MAVFQFETRLKAPPPTATEAPLPAPVTPAARAFLSFAEHCTECAAPACYATCDLFDPTPAGKCRRFDHGIQPLRSGSRVLADVRFRKWGKLEARGSVAPLPARRITILESALAHAALWMARIGAFLSRMLGARWHRLEDHLHERLRRRLGQGRQAPLPNSFRAEIVNPGTAPVKLQLAIVIDQERVGGIIALEDQPHPFRQSITAAPGYNCIEVPGGAFAPVAASGLPFLVQITIDGDEGAHLMFGALDFVWDAPAPPAPTDPDAPFRPPAKCVVFDLDNTIWDGVLLEGPVTVQPGIADLFRQLDARGVLLSVASKNARADAMARLEAAGLADYLLHPQISWAPKSEGLAAIAASLNIGTDSLLFVDDNPFERAEVAAALPMVEVLPDSDLQALADHPRLRGSVTEESRNRREMYRAASARTHAGAAYADYRAFLKDCAIEVIIRPDQPEDFPRIAELAQRTNQLNFTGRKYDRSAIAALLGDPRQARFVVEVRDRFGSYGLVGFCLAGREGDTVVMQEFMLSCRVQGKYVEQAVFAYLADHLPGPTAACIAVNFRPTPRNAAALRVLETLGFSHRGGRYVRGIAPGDLSVDFLTVIAA